jgi:putative membrane protein
VRQLSAVQANLAWSLDPLPIASATVVGGVYVARWRRVREHDGPRAASVGRLACFMSGVLLALLAVISPLDSLADQLFVMHMAQHIVLLDLAPVLALLGCTRALLRPVTRVMSRVEHRAPLLLSPWFALCAYVLVVWLWHIPAAYDAALRHPDSLHVLEHLSFLIVGTMYWWHILSPVRGRLTRGSMQPIIYMAVTKVLVGALGMGLAFIPTTEYSFYAHQGRIWGLSARGDQGAAGVLMALEQSIVMGIAIAWLFMRALAESEREQQRRERYELIG